MSRIVLALAAIGIGFLARRLQKDVEDLQRRLTVAAPHLIRAGVDEDQWGPFLNWSDWREIAQGGNTNPGRMGNRHSCPCQSEYTVANNQVIINAWPNPAALAACAANLPAPEAAWWKCDDDCVQVMTHVWHGWDVVRNVKTGQLRFNCYTFAQYHCKKPDDPDRFRPPKPTDPNDPTPEL